MKNLKEFFKPTKEKTIFSIIITFIWYLICKSYTAMILCEPCSFGGFENCTDFYSLLLIKQGFCYCTCIRFTEVLLQYFWIIILPFALSYLVYSLIAFLISKYKKRKK